MNIGGSAPAGAGVDDTGTFATCSGPPNYAGAAGCAADRIAPTNANGTAGTDGQTGGGGGGDAGSSARLTSSSDTSHENKGVGDTFNAGTNGTDGYIALVSCI